MLLDESSFGVERLLIQLLPHSVSFFQIIVPNQIHALKITVSAVALLGIAGCTFI